MSESGFIGFEDLQDLIILGLTDKSRNNEPQRPEACDMDNFLMVGRAANDSIYAVPKSKIVEI